MAWPTGTNATSHQAIDVPAASQGMLQAARRLLRRKERQLSRRFLAEGRQATSEALRQPGTVIELIVADDSVGRHIDLLQTASDTGARIAAAPARTVTELAATVTPQGLVAVCQMVDVPASEALAGKLRLVVLCDQVRDPGNLGTVIRCADAFGADAVLISRDSGLQVFGADSRARRTIDHLAQSGELAQPTMWVLGNEAWGLQPDHTALLDRLVALPLYGRAQSLNLATAAAVFLYASATAQRS